MKSAHIVCMGRFSFWSAFGFTGIAIFALLFFPVYLQLNAHFDLNRKRLIFSLLAYKKIKLIGGYAKPYKGGVAFHISDKKAIVLDYSEMDGERKKFSFMKTFKLQNLQLTTETGAEYLLGVIAAQTVIYAFLTRFPSRRGKIRANLWLTDGDVLRVSTRLTVFFNLFILLKAFLKFLKEKIKILWQKRVKTSTT